MDDREARYGVSFGLSDLDGSLDHDAEHLTLEKPGLISLSAGRAHRTVRLGDAGGRRSYERICESLQFRCLKHELQIKHDV